MANDSSLFQGGDTTSAVNPSEDNLGALLVQQYMRYTAQSPSTSTADGLRSQSGAPKSPSAADATNGGHTGSHFPVPPLETEFDAWKHPLPTASPSDQLSHARQDLIAKSDTMVPYIRDNIDTFYKFDGFGILPNKILKTDAPQVVEGKKFIIDDIWNNPTVNNFHFTFFDDSTVRDELSDFQAWMPKATARFDNVLRWADAAEHISELDKNKDGFLDRSELAAKYDPAKYPDLYKEFDTLAQANKNSNNPGVSKADIENFIGNEMLQTDNQFAMGLYEVNFSKNGDQLYTRMKGLFDKLDTNGDGKIDKTELTNAINDPAALPQEKAIAQIVLDNFAGFCEAGQMSSWIDWPKPQSIERNAFGAFLEVATSGPQDTSNISKAQTKKAIVELLENNLLP